MATPSRMLDDLFKIALVGTARGGGLPIATGPVADALASLPPAENAESALLRAIVMTAGYLACGRVPTQAQAAAQAASSPAPAEVKPVCSPRASDILDQLLAMSQTPAKLQMLDQWLRCAAQAGKRPPHALLPALLDFGQSRRAAREPINAVVGERGHWLMKQNPKWNFGVDEQQTVEDAWSTGTPSQRLAALRRARAQDPAAARAMIQSTWKEDSADERSAFIATLSDKLSADDEPLLEAALDDRSKLVRSAVVDLLARLPGSAFVGRMIARADAILIHNGKQIEVVLPQAFDPLWTRDGIEEKPPQRMGQKQWWMQQIIGAVPVVHWSNQWKLNPTECITRLEITHFDGVIDAWSRAAERAKDAAWAVSLLRACAYQKPNEIDLFSILPAGERSVLFDEALAGIQLPMFKNVAPPTEVDLSRIHQILSSFTGELSASMTRSLLRQLDPYFAGQSSRYDYVLPAVLTEAALRVPVESFDDLASRWTGIGWIEKPLETFLQTLQLRRDIQQEFAK